MATNTLYRNYFKYQAERHPLLLHSDESGQRTFGVISIEEHFADIRTGGKPGSCIFRLINYTYDLSSPGHETHKNVQGAFFAAGYHSHRNDGPAGLLAAMDQAEEIVDDFIERMVTDSRNGHPLFARSMDRARDIQVVPKYHTADSGYSGWSCFFKFTHFFRDCIEEHPDDNWKMPTPHTL